MLDLTKFCENNYFSTLESKLRSFQMRLNMQSIVANIQLYGLEMSKVINVCFVQTIPKHCYNYFS